MQGLRGYGLYKNRFQARRGACALLEPTVAPKLEVGALHW